MSRISVAETAQCLGVTPQFIRVGLQKKQLPIGSAVKMNRRWTYHISPKLLAEYIGKDKLEEYFGEEELR